MDASQWTHPNGRIPINASRLQAINYAETLRRSGMFEVALKLERSTLATSSQVFGPEHPSTLLAMTNLGETLCKMGETNTSD